MNTARSQPTRSSFLKIISGWGCHNMEENDNDSPKLFQGMITTAPQSRNFHEQTDASRDDPIPANAQAALRMSR